MKRDVIIQHTECNKKQKISINSTKYIIEKPKCPGNSTQTIKCINPKDTETYGNVLKMVQNTCIRAKHKRDCLKPDSQNNAVSEEVGRDFKDKVP